MTDIRSALSSVRSASTHQDTADHSDLKRCRNDMEDDGRQDERDTPG